MEFGAKHLHTLADEVGASEIVVPDVLGDYEGTISRALGFGVYARPEYRYMLVLQGSAQDEVLKCLRAYTQMPVTGYATTIGIPRLLCNIDREFRITLAKFLEKEHLDHAWEYHALGSSSWIKEVVLLADHPIIRGLDTSLPLYMGLNGHYIGASLTKYYSRPDDFFDRAQDNHPDIVERNIETYLQWAGYDPDAPLPERNTDAESYH